MKKRLGMALVVFLPLLMTRTALADLNEGLMGYWPFNGNANDESGNGNHGTVQGATLTSDRFGNENNAYLFDEPIELIQLPHTVLDGLLDFTLSIHLKVFDNSKGMGIFSGANSEQFNEALLWFGDFIFTPTIKGRDIRTQATMNSNSWTHIVWVRSGNFGTTMVYVNGIPARAAISEQGIVNISPDGLWLGNEQDSVAGSWDSGQQFLGIMDDIRLYNRTLSDTEVSTLFEQEKVPPTLLDTVRAQGYESGRQACINNPRSCGIEGTASVIPGTIVPVCNGSVCGGQWSLPPEPTDTMGYIPIDRFRPDHGDLWENPLMFQPSGGTFSDSSGSSFDATRFEPNWYMNGIEGLFQVRYACQASWYSGKKDLDWMPANIVGAIKYCVYPAKIPEVVNYLRAVADDLACTGGMESCQ